MKKAPITICKAQPIGSEDVPSAELRIDGTIPTFPAGPVGDAEMQSFYDQQAELIMDGLYALPGGTMHALLIRMLMSKVNVLRIREP